MRTWKCDPSTKTNGEQKSVLINDTSLPSVSIDEKIQICASKFIEVAQENSG